MDNGASSYRRFLSGDDSAFEDIIRDYKDGLMLYLNNFTDNIFIAEDLMQDTFVKLVTKRPHYSGRSSFKTWLYAIGRNTALDYLRRHRPTVDVPVDELAVLASAEEVERDYLKDEDKRALHKAISALKAEYRQILWLAYFEELPLKECAVIMKKSTRAAETLVWRARQALKVKLEEENFTYEGL